MGAAMPSNHTRVSPSKVGTLPSMSICAPSITRGPTLDGKSTTISPGATLPPERLAAFTRPLGDNAGASLLAFPAVQKNRPGSAHSTTPNLPTGWHRRFRLSLIPEAYRRIQEDIAG